MVHTVSLEPALHPGWPGRAGGPWLHVPFLEHAELGGPDAGERAIAAFLVLRLADAVHLTRAPETVSHARLEAAGTYLDGLRPQTTEVDHLRAVLAAVARPSADRLRALADALVAFAAWLEEEFRLTEALDVLDTGLAIARLVTSPETQTCVMLRGARALRLAGHTDEAMSAYTRAGTLASESADAHGVLLSRIGRAITLQQLGNLPAAEQLLCDVVADAAHAGDRDALARATHDLAVNSLMQGRPDRAATQAFRAYELYTDAEPRDRALSDAGIALRELGYDTAALDAFHVVVARNPTVGVRVRAGLELLFLYAKLGDHTAFDQWHATLKSVENDMPPRVAVDFDIKLGQAYAMFDHPDLARMHYGRAIARAERYRLNELLFRAEQGLKSLGRETAEPRPCIDWATQFPEVAEVAGTLRTLLIE